MKDRKPTSILVWISISFVAAIFWTELFLSQRNILAYKKGWRLASLDFLNPEIFTTRVYTSLFPLSGYRLKSNPDLGIVRLLSESEVVPKKVKLWFRLGDGGFVDVIFNSSLGNYTAVRFSRSSLFPSRHIRSTHDEKYASSLPLKFQVSEGFHSVELQSGAIEYDGRVVRSEGLTFLKGKVGVQLSPQSAEVFWLKVKAKESELTLDFFPDGNRGALYLRHFLILGVLTLLMGFIPGLGRRKIVNFLAGAGALLLLWDILIGLHVKEETEDVKAKFSVMDRWWVPPVERSLGEKLKALKKDDSDSVKFLCKKDGCEKVLTRTPLPPKTGERILIFGGSQLKYALVREYQESFHFKFDQALRKLKPKVETINLSTPGFFWDRMKAYGYGATLDNVDPDTIILETLAWEAERPFIRFFITEMKKKGRKIIALRTPQNPLNFNEAELPFVLSEMKKGLASEAKDLSQDTRWLALRSVSFFRKTTKEFQFPLLDPNTLFLDETVMQSGQIFWDRVHLSIYGQELLAEWLADEVAKLN